MPRFTVEESEINRRAREVLRNPSSNPEEKSSARKAIERLNLERSRRVEVKKSAGAQPTRKDFASDGEYETALREWWTKLDRLAAEKEAHKVLSDPNASVYLRRKAYEKLGIAPEIDDPDTEEQSVKGKKTDRGPMREDFGFRSGHDWPEFVASGKEAQFQAALDKWRETAPPLDPKLAVLLQ